MGLTTAQQRALTRLRSSGASDLGVGLDNSRLTYLLAVIARDLGYMDAFPELPIDVPELYDRIPSDSLSLEGPRFVPLYERLLKVEANADTYLYCLGSLFKARLKYERILQAQPVPTVEQVGPRSLLQFGQIEPGPLAAFLFWRKWIYDIDNRAGQETGYLFEPIVAQAIGGVPYGARNSPIRRGGKGKGRQVDCVHEREDELIAYELKLRVTIAASGQGRWGEELSFPRDCRASGYKPILIVFDDTENDKLSALQGEFLNEGGEAYVGPAAWAHLEGEAGATMTEFLEKYVRRPINEILRNAPSRLPSITFSMDGDELRVTIDGDQLRVERAAAEDAVATDLFDEAEAEAQQLPDDVDEATDV